MISIIVPIEETKEGQRVYKPTGSAAYTVKHSIKIYSDDKEQRKEIKNYGVYFMVQSSGNIQAVPANQPVRIEFETRRDMLKWLWPKDAHFDVDELYETGK